jgi:hypothetical protein
MFVRGVVRISAPSPQPARGDQEFGTGTQEFGWEGPTWPMAVA